MVSRVLTNQRGIGHGFWPCVGPVLRVSPLTSQVAFALQASDPMPWIANTPKFTRILPRSRVASLESALVIHRIDGFYTGGWLNHSTAVALQYWCAVATTTLG